MEEALMKVYTTELASIALGYLTGANYPSDHFGQEAYNEYTSGLSKYKKTSNRTSSSYDFHNVFFQDGVPTALTTPTQDEDVEHKTRLLKMTADAGNSYAQAALGKAYLRAKEGSNIKEGIRYMALASSQGNVYAKFELANFYYHGVVEWGIAKDPTKAAQLYSECTSAFHEAQEILGRMYYVGDGVEKDLKKAEELLKAASARGNVAAEAILELMRERNQME
jgi:TPR repeat protein